MTVTSAEPAGEAPTPNKIANDADKDMSEEDIQLRDQLNMLVERLCESDKKLYQPALESMRTLIRSSTTSMTSVPKPLKFMRQHYGKMKEIYDNLKDPKPKSLCADIVSVLAMTMTDTTEFKFDTLKYRILGSHEEIGAWGHEYVRHITGQIVGMWNELDLSSTEPLVTTSKELREEYIKLVDEMIPYMMKHNAESEAIDLCIEIEQLDMLIDYTSHANYQRVCLYMVSCVPYLPEPDNNNVLRCALKLYRKFDDIGSAMRCALHLNDTSLTLELFKEAHNIQDKSKQEQFKHVTQPGSVQKQLSFLLGKQQFVNPYDEVLAEDDEELAEILGNTKLFEHFIALGRELDILEPKVPEDVYKSHLDSTRQGLASKAFDSMRSNLADSYVNGLLNCGFGKERLLQDESKETQWLGKQKEFGKMSAVATLGWVMLWDLDCGLSQIDRYFYNTDDFTRAGALLGCGVVSCGVKNECDPALALLGDYIDKNTECLSRAAIIGLGVAYSGSLKAEAIAKLTPIVLDTSSHKLQNACLAALSCGLIAVGSLNDEVTSTIIQTMLERPEAHFNNPFAKFMALGLALTCLGRQDDAEVILASLEAVSEPIKSMAHMMCDFCAFAGTGNVLKIQQLLHILSEQYEEREEKASATAAATTKEKERKKEEKESPATRTRSKKRGESTAKETETAKSDSDTQQQQQQQSGSSREEFDFLAHQGIAALGVAVISMGEENGLDMTFRQFGHLLRFSELPIKRAVPLAIALSYVSNPQLKVLDTLSKFSHDSDPELAYNSILALGLVGAGTNNARLAAMLRQLAIYHSRDNYSLFMVRLAQGLTHLGKGTMTLSPYHSDRFLMRPVSVAGLLALLVACIDTRTTFMARHDYLLFYLTPAIQPRLFMTFDEQLKPLPVTVRVGQAVDVVGQAGRPKTLTGFQTHTTPVLLAHGERAELATEEYLPVTKLPLEGFVILAKNPDYDATQHA